MRTTVAISETPGSPFALTEVDLDEPRADEVLVRIVGTGLCHTDLTVGEMMPAEMFPRVLGHEGAGVVEALGAEVDGLEVGDHVVLSYASCRACPACLAGRPGYCEQHFMLNYMGLRMDGTSTMTRDGSPVFGSFFGQSSLARHALVSPAGCVVVDRSLDLARLGPYGCAFQTGAGTVLEALGSGPDDTLVVTGAGAVGLAAIAAAGAVGVGTVVAVDRQPDRLALAESFGATSVDSTGLDDAALVQRVKELTGGGATQGIDTTGVASVVRAGVAALRPRGELVVLGLGSPEITLDAVDLMSNGKVVRGCVEGDADPQTMIPRLFDLAATGRFDVDRLVVTYPFEEIGTAVADAGSGRTVKPVLVW